MNYLFHFMLQNTPPEEQEGIYKALFDCNCDISEENRFVVPFIVAAAVPCGLLYKEHLELNPTVSDTFTALMNCSRTNQIAINMIMFALKMAGCCPVKMERIQETSSQSNDIHALEDDKIKQSVLFHKLLVDIINALPAELRRQVIYESSEYLSSNPVHTQMLHVHFLRLIQATVIGYRNVTKLHAMIESIRRPDILDDIDEYCREVGLPVLCRQGKNGILNLSIKYHIYRGSVHTTTTICSKILHSVIKHCSCAIQVYALWCIPNNAILLKETIQKHLPRMCLSWSHWRTEGILVCTVWQLFVVLIICVLTHSIL